MKMLIGLILLVSYSSLAEPGKKPTIPTSKPPPPVAQPPASQDPKNEEENKILESLISQLISEINKASFDFDFKNLVIDTTEKAKNTVSLESLNVKAQVSFTDDITVDFVRDETGEVGSSVQKFRTYLVLGTKGLVFDIEGHTHYMEGNLAAQFFLLDAKAKEFVPHLLSASVKSKLTESVLRIDIRSLAFDWKTDEKTGLTLISGIANTESQLFDIRNQRYYPKKTQVSFTGSIGKDLRPKISISYVNKLDGKTQ